MSSAATNRPAGVLAGAQRPARFPDFSTAPVRHNSDERVPQASTTFGNGGTWHPASLIWGNTIGAGLGNTKRDPSRARVPESPGGQEIPSGSGALAASSEADPWTNNGPWNPDTTSPTLPSSHSGSTSPTYTRGSISNGTSQTLMDLQNQYQTRPAIGQGASFSRPQPKSNLDPSAGGFQFHRRPSFAFGDDKENAGQYSSHQKDVFEGEVNRSYNDHLAPRGNNYLNPTSQSREPSMPPSRTSETNLASFGNGNGNHSYGLSAHGSSASIHSQRPSVSNFGAQTGNNSNSNGARHFADLTTQTEADMRDRFGGLEINPDSERRGSYQSNYSPSHATFPPQNYLADAGSATWNKPNVPDSYIHHQFPEQGMYNKQRFENRPTSSADGDYRRGMNSPKFYPGPGTPSIASDQFYRPVSRGARALPPANELNRLPNMYLAQQQAFFHYNQFRGQYPLYEYPPQAFRGNPYGYPMQLPAYPMAQVIPTRPAKDQDIGVGVRSMLLEEFRSNSKSNKRYDLKDIYNHVVEFSGDQHGSRFIQQKLETANSDEKEQLFREIQPNALQLMTDVFGNYVIQKLFEHGNQVQKRVLADSMKNHVMELSQQMYGCRVVQKALEHVLADQQASMVKELEADVVKCVKDQNGNHVIQKAIERCPSDDIQFIIEAFRGQVQSLAGHPYGCRVIQRMLEFCTARDQVDLLVELHQCSTMLITDQYGNYVTQHVIEHGKPEDRAKVIRIVTAQLQTFSKHKFASNVVEKAIHFGDDEQRKAIVAQLTSQQTDGSSPLQLMMKDQYGNYVIQKLLARLQGQEREDFVEHMKPQLLALKKYNFGKQIAAIEKLIFVAPTGPSSQHTPSPITTQTLTIETNSTIPTPMLTNGQNSPQSCSLPSTSVSTIDEPTSLDKSTGMDASDTVIINDV